MKNCEYACVYISTYVRYVPGVGDRCRMDPRSLLVEFSMDMLPVPFLLFTLLKRRDKIELDMIWLGKLGWHKKRYRMIRSNDLMHDKV